MRGASFFAPPSIAIRSPLAPPRGSGCNLVALWGCGGNAPTVHNAFRRRRGLDYIMHK